MHQNLPAKLLQFNGQFEGILHIYLDDEVARIKHSVNFFEEVQASEASMNLLRTQRSRISEDIYEGLSDC